MTDSWTAWPALGSNQPSGFIRNLSGATGISTDLLQCLTAILAAYPVAQGYRVLFLHRPTADTTLRNAYVLFCGFVLALWFMQDSPADIAHSLLCICGTWLACALVQAWRLPRVYAAAFAWILNSGYLFVGYYYDNLKSSSYKVDWLTPQCVLCLRMISFAMDFMDGGKKRPDGPARGTGLTEDQLGLAELPSLWHTMGYAYHFGGFLVGPQFPYERYRRWLTGELFALDRDVKVRGKEMKKGQHYVPSSFAYAAQCFGWAVLNLGMTQLGRAYFPTTFLVTPDYARMSFAAKLGYLWVAGKFALQKYLGIWKLSEVPCVISGLVYNGYREGSTPAGLWGSLSNIRLPQYEIPWCLQDIVTTFNTNTNNWSKIYLFKRLRFLGSKELSALFTLMYLAAWHGWHVGYFICFGLEFLDMEAERTLRGTFGPIYNWLEGELTKGTATGYIMFPAYRVLCWLLTTSALFYSAGVAFDLLKWDLIKVAYGEVYWIGHVAIFAAVVISKVARPLIKHHPAWVSLKDVKQQNGQQNGHAKEKKSE
ncbi:MBOAT, membrane-bound O-acyltransferase family-domain-containing protein [Hyaloraphidium curvatum]|nr:MBOAT, membrane-bound O-acyltransferase family-domain-containing protein [Hyaloraphidium curvatum]